MKIYSVEIKKWFLRKLNDKTSQYNMLVDCEPWLEDDDNDYIYCYDTDILKETDKAWFIEFSTETSSGKCRSYKSWVPKSVSRVEVCETADNNK